MILNEAELQHMVEVGESAIFRDSETEEIVAVVLRDVCGDPGVLKWITEVARENVGWRRNVRVRNLCFLIH